MEISFGINKKYWMKNEAEGGHQPATRVEGAPYPLGAPPVLVGPLAGLRCPSLAIWCVLTWKNQKEAFRTKRRHLEAEPGQNQSRAPAELFC